jgi:hypothetical protein
MLSRTSVTRTRSRRRPNAVRTWPISWWVIGRGPETPRCSSVIALASAAPIHTGSSRWSPLASSSSSTGRCAPGSTPTALTRISCTAHPPSPRPGVASACLTRAEAGRCHSTLDTRIPAITWRRHDDRVPRGCEPRWPTTRAVYRPLTSLRYQGAGCSARVARVPRGRDLRPGAWRCSSVRSAHQRCSAGRPRRWRARRAPVSGHDEPPCRAVGGSGRSPAVDVQQVAGCAHSFGTHRVLARLDQRRTDSGRIRRCCPRRIHSAGSIVVAGNWRTRPWASARTSSTSLGMDPTPF